MASQIKEDDTSRFLQTDYTVDEDSWLYGSTENNSDTPAKEVTDEGQPALVGSELGANIKDVVASRLSVDAPVFEPKSRSGSVASESAAADNVEIQSGNNGNVEQNEGGEEGEGGNEGEVEEDDDDDDDDDSDDDDVQVMIGEVKTSNTYDAAAGKYKAGGYQRQGSTGTAAPGTTTTAAKAAQKGVDLDSVGNINGVSVFEFDMDSVKTEDKPWRKPGADITDYFNYGFNEDTWTKYCERQRRLRLENSKSSNIVVVGNSNVGGGHRPGPIKTLEIINSSNNNSGLYGSRLINPGPLLVKVPGVIDVIGSSAHDSRRPMHHDLNPAADIVKLEPKELPPPSSSVVLPVGMSMPPPTVITLPPPDFNLLSSVTLPPPGGLPPAHFSGPPPGMLQPQIPMSAGPPPIFPVGAPPFDTFFRPGVPMSIERRAPPPHAFPGDRPPFGFDQFGRPQFNPPPQGMMGQPPHLPPQQLLPPGAQPLQLRPNEMFDRSRMPLHPQGPGFPPPGPRCPSPDKSDSDISSSDDERDHRPQHPLRLEPVRHDPPPGPIGSYGRPDDHREFRRSNSRDRSRLRDADYRSREADRGRDYDYRGRDREHDRGRDYDRGGRDYRERGRSRERERERDRSRDRERERSRERERERSRERKYARDRDDRRREEDEEYYRKKKIKREKSEENRSRSRGNST